MGKPMGFEELARLEMVSQLRQWAKGEKTWAEVEGIESGEARAVADLGCDLAEAGHLHEALAIFEGLVAINPLDAAAHAALGTILQKLNRCEEALDAYGLALNLDAQNVVALANRGELRLKGADQRGFQDLIDAVALDPEGHTAGGRRAKALVQAISLKVAQRPTEKAEPPRGIPFSTRD